MSAEKKSVELFAEQGRGEGGKKGAAVCSTLLALAQRQIDRAVIVNELWGAQLRGL